MSIASHHTDHIRTAGEFLATDQHDCGDAVLRLAGVGISMPLSKLHEFVTFEQPAAGSAGEQAGETPC